MTEPQPSKPTPPLNGGVTDSGGGMVHILVDRDTGYYPPEGERVSVSPCSTVPSQLNELGQFLSTLKVHNKDVPCFNDHLAVAHLKQLLHPTTNSGKGETTEDTSDGYHTFKELYEFRLLYNAALFNEWAAQRKYKVHKSWKHSDSELAFGGGWFVVVAELPTGQITNHYEAKDWDLFKVPEATVAHAWDGHTPADVAKRLRETLLNGTTSPSPTSPDVKPTPSNTSNELLSPQELIDELRRAEHLKLPDDDAVRLVKHIESLLQQARTEANQDEFANGWQAGIQDAVGWIEREKPTTEAIYDWLKSQLREGDK